MRPKQITLSDIAQKLNVSTVTVSKALRDHPDISPETKKAVKKISEELGYSPNFMARNLSSRKSNMIGVVLPKIAQHFFSSIIEHIYDFAFANNYEIILTVSQENAERQVKHVQTLLSMRVDGMIISISQDTKDLEIFEIVKSRQIPLVFMDRIPDIDGVNKVRVDDYGGAYKAIEHAIKIGYKNIAHFSGNLDINIGRERLNGYKAALKDNGIKINPDWIVKGDFGEKSGYDSFMKLYHENKLPDLIFTVTYPVALGVYAAAQEVGMRIPDDIDVICFGDAMTQSFLSPPLSCINQPTKEIADNSMQVLLDNIHNKEDFQAKEIVIDTNLILRGTCIGNLSKTNSRKAKLTS
ncbi:MAG: LacI family DNA-binding transcriptional regulator [Bacteroidota bacterium]|nr:LacI family DNA-binding transcriptional regulator [Bacteroidota bacterium]MDP4190531.1 LacI family DNA-binding transcriptional regulator [Bacteroidota bacterium]MDP4193666.1 LacI family DNA-binding transcriptional regulator [Bacteroidota bacterium]